MKKESISVRNATQDDVPAILEVALKAYPKWSELQRADERNYQRVRYCAQARAVENTIYVVLAGNVGALEVEREVANVRPLVDRHSDIYTIERHITIQKIKVS